MGSLSSALLSSSSALIAIQSTFDTISNNVANANTPGYAEQDPVMLADPFDQNAHYMRQRLFGFGIQGEKLLN